MADKKITQLTALTQIDNLDLFAVVDISVLETKKMSAADLFASPRPIGSVNPSTGDFTTLHLTSGATISEFSTDNTLSGNSDTAVPTEKAVREYIINNQNKIYQGDSSIEIIDTTSTSGTITVTVDSTVQAVFDSTGLTLATGVSVNEISNDAGLSDVSQTSLVTEYAIKYYVDTQINDVRIEVGIANIRNISSDTTAVIGDVCLVDTNSGIVTITLLETDIGRLIIKKISTDSNPIYITSGSSIDSEDFYVIETSNKSVTFMGDGTAFYII